MQCFSCPTEICPTDTSSNQPAASLSCHIADNHGTDVEGTAHYKDDTWNLITGFNHLASSSFFPSFENLKMTLASSGKHQPGWKHVLHCVYQRGELIKGPLYYIIFRFRRPAADCPAAFTHELNQQPAVDDIGRSRQCGGVGLAEEASEPSAGDHSLSRSGRMLWSAGTGKPRPASATPDLTRQPNFIEAHHRWLAIGRLEPGPHDL